MAAAAVGAGAVVWAGAVVGASDVVGTGTKFGGRAATGAVGNAERGFVAAAAIATMKTAVAT
jgi:hypothetical protein